MMKPASRLAALAIIATFALAAPAAAQMSTPVKYEGRWEIQPNGDVKVTRTFTLGMEDFRKWRNADVDMFEARGFAAERSPVAVGDRSAPEWNSSNRTLTLKMTVMGLTRNMGDHWEAVMLPGEKFSNIDEGKKIAYFHFTSDTAIGRIEGQDLVILPPGAARPQWKESDRKIIYELPYVAPAATVAAAPAPAAAATRTVTETRTVNSPLPVLFLALFGVALAGGLTLLAMSFIPRQNARN